MAKLKKMFRKALIVTALVAIVVAIGYIVVKSNSALKYETKVERVEVIKEIDTSVEKIEDIKQQLVEDLSTNCEVLGVPAGQQNGKTIMDTNGYYSRGKWQFQTKTVQYYYEKFYGKDITVDEAVLIAHTEDKARDLAYDIIWKEVGGVWNWQNCANKLGLAQKIEIIRQLEAK